MRISVSMILVLALSGCAGIQRAQHGDEVSIDRSSLAAARAALNEGQAGTSLAIADGILASQPNNVSALAEAGDAQAAMGDRLSAETSYKHALRIAPRDVRARLGMGKLLLRDDLKGAEQAFRAILADAPHDPVVLNDLGYVLDLQERHADAQNIYLEALASDPSRLSTRVNLALSLALSGQADKAEQMLRDLAQNAGANSKVRLDFALAQVIAGHDQDAQITMSADLSPEEAKNALAGMEQLRPAISTPSK
jgi:Flp pilus assembly protein TadD